MGGIDGCNLCLSEAPPCTSLRRYTQFKLLQKFSATQPVLASHSISSSIKSLHAIMSTTPGVQLQSQPRISSPRPMPSTKPAP